MRRDRTLAAQIKNGKSTAQYRPSPSNCPDDSGSHRLASMNSPYAAPKRDHTNGVATRNTPAARPFSVSYGAVGTVARNVIGCVRSARISRPIGSHDGPPG